MPRGREQLEEITGTGEARREARSLQSEEMKMKTVAASLANISARLSLNY